MKTLQAIIAMALAVVLWGCNTSGCLDSNSSIPLVGFCDKEGNAISVDSLEIGGVNAPEGKLLTTSLRAISQIYLPLRSSQDSASFFIRYMRRDLRALELADTITFFYTAIPSFVSEECGVMMDYTITSCRYTTWLIDKVEVIDPNISNADKKSVEILFRTADPEEPEGDNPDENNPADDEDSE